MQREGPLGGRSQAGGLKHDWAGGIACELRAAHSSRQQLPQGIPLQQSELASGTGAQSSRERCANHIAQCCAAEAGLQLIWSCRAEVRLQATG